MDSFTHLVAGALTPLAFRHCPKRAALVGFGIAAGELPDIDVIFGASPEAFMLLHRGITHALFWQPVMALLVVVPVYIWLCARKAPAPGVCPLKAWQSSAALPGQNAVALMPQSIFGALDAHGNPSFIRLWLMALLALVLHIYLDCMTTFGTQVLLPFSSQRVGLPAMFIVDFLLTLPALTLLLLALRQQPDSALLCGATRVKIALYAPKARRFAQAGLAWIILYPLVSLGINAATTAALSPTLAKEAGHNPAVSHVILLTEPFSPFVWKAVVDDGNTWSMTVFASGSKSPRRFYEYTKPDPALYAALKRQEALFVHFENFAPLMTQSKRKANYVTQTGHTQPITEYAFADLRYTAMPESFATKLGRGDTMFVLEARVNASGALLAYRFLKRAAQADSTPWISAQ